jgi:hypothetical protein
MFTGMWLIVWIVVADQNAVMRARIRNKLGKLQDPDYVPEHTGRLATILLIFFILFIIIAAIGSQ